MYREQDFEEISAQLRTRRAALLSAVGAVLALAIVSFALRWPQAVTAGLTIVALCAFIFCYAMFVYPLRAYRKHIDQALHGHTHTTQGVFTEMEADSVVREGVRLVPFTVNVGAGVRDDGNRLFYYDANLPRPDWQAGETLLITSHDNRVTDWTRVKIKA